MLCITNPHNFELAELYKGAGVESNPELGMEWPRLAAAQQYPKAPLRTSLHYELRMV